MLCCSFLNILRFHRIMELLRFEGPLASSEDHLVPTPVGTSAFEMLKYTPDLDN